MTEENQTSNTNEQKKNFTENLTDAISKLKVASDDAKKRFEEIREENGVDSNDFKNATQIVTEYVSVAAANAKAAYEKAGGLEGISTSATQEAAKLSANVKILQENISNSEQFKSAVKSVKDNAAKVSDTDFIKNLTDHAKKLSDIAHETYKQTYDAKHAEKSSE